MGAYGPAVKEFDGWSPSLRQRCPKATNIFFASARVMRLGTTFLWHITLWLA